jgi:hypothetical protein
LLCWGRSTLILGIFIKGVVPGMCVSISHGVVTFLVWARVQWAGYQTFWPNTVKDSWKMGRKFALKNSFLIHLFSIILSQWNICIFEISIKFTIFVHPIYVRISRKKMFHLSGPFFKFLDSKPI